MRPLIFLVVGTVVAALAVGVGSNPARLVRQQALDHRPLEIRQIKTRHSKTPTVWNLESQTSAFGNQFYGYVT